LPVDTARLQTLKVPVLVYHHIRDTKPYPKSTWSWKMSVTPSIFEKYLQWIADHSYTTIDLTTLAAIFRGEIRGPEKPIVITFDDNQLSQYDIALPMMEARSQIGVFYLITNHLTNKTMIDTVRAKDLHARGQDVESHTLSHRVLTALPASEIERELRESRKILEDLLGKQVLHVAYPGTAHNQTVRDAAAAAGYLTASVMDPRKATAQDGLMKLPRIMMTDDTDLAKVLP
jgi:peptidoglycan/xylan/chitin deacetylase (PgdA/CDA1 family)